MAPADLEKVKPGCREFVRVVEDLIIKRQRTAQNNHARKAWQLKELYEIYPSYEDIRRGKIESLPPRDEVVKIAKKFFKATPEETNLLLIAAQYGILDHYLSGDNLDSALLVAQSILSIFPLPSFVITRDFTIHRWNRFAPLLFGLSEEQLREQSQEARNLLRYVFDPSMPLYQVISQDFSHWRHITNLIVFWFKSDNIHFRYDDWYEAIAKVMMRYPGFEQIWREVDLDYQPSSLNFGLDSSPHYLFDILLPAPNVCRMRLVQTKYFDKEYPRIISFLPVNAMARQIFTALGVPLLGHSE